MNTYIYICIHTHTYMYIYTNIYTYALLCLFVWRAREEASPTRGGPLLKLGDNYSSFGKTVENAARVPPKTQHKICV